MPLWCNRSKEIKENPRCKKIESIKISSKSSKIVKFHVPPIVICDKLKKYSLFGAAPREATNHDLRQVKGNINIFGAPRVGDTDEPH